MITEAYSEPVQNSIFEDDSEGIFHFKNVESKRYSSISQHSPGAKLDHEKPKLDLVLGDFAKALVEVGKVGTMGANKYSEHGWLSVPNAETRYLSAALRHYYNHKDEDESNIDSESNLPHLAHMAWNALAVLELYLRKQK